MKRIFAAALALCLLLCLCACGGQQDDNTTTEATTAASETTEATEAKPTYTHTVKVVDEGGNPIVGAMVQICQGETCLPGITGEDGVAGYNGSEGVYEIKFMKMPDGYTYAGEEQVFTFPEGSTDAIITLKAVA